MVNFKILMCERDQHSNVNLKGNTCSYSIDFQRTYSNRFVGNKSHRINEMVLTPNSSI